MKPMRMSAGASGSGKIWWLTGSAWSIELAPCWRPWGWMATIPSGGMARGGRGGPLETLRTALGGPLPPHARARILRLLDRLDLVCAQIAELEQERDAALEKEAPDKAEKMIRQLVGLRGIGVQSATVLVREGFVREFANGKALGSYAGLTPTPFSSGSTEREQGIGKAGNRRLRSWPRAADVPHCRQPLRATARRTRGAPVARHLAATARA